ncbi:MAG: hypothetical protein Q9164_007607 [Protoblastenia rupestris]
MTDTHSSGPPGIKDEARRTLTNPMLKDEVFFEKYGIETNGEYTRLKIKVAPGGGTPLHYHNTYSERFIAEDGTLTVVVGDETHQLNDGADAFVPIGTMHQFRNDNPDRRVTFYVEIRPAHLGFEKSLYVLYGMARDGLCNENGIPKSLILACLLGDMSDMSSPGVIMTLGKTFVMAMAAYARWTGEEERLLKEYWY